MTRSLEAILRNRSFYGPFAPHALNSYTGGTTIAAGMLQVGAGGTSGSIDTTSGMVDNGVLVFNRSDSPTFAVAVSGSGGLRQAGPGTLILTASNSCSGQTTVNAGVLQLGNGGTSGSIDATSGVTVNGILAFNRSDNIVFRPAISGSGGLNKSAGNTLTLAGNSSYTGGTTVGAGTLVVTGALGDTPVNVAAEAALVVNGSLGNGGVTVNAGTLNLAGTLGSGAVAVNDAAVLTGTGSIAGPVTVAGNANLTNTATLNLVDGTIGTLTLSSPGTALTLGSGAVVDMEIAASNNADCVALTAGGLALNAAVGLNVTPLGTLSAGTYNLFTFSGGTSGSGGFYLNPIAGLPGTLMAVLNTTANSEQLIITASIPPVAYWQGGAGANWSSTSNWTADAAGARPVVALPGSITDLCFTTTGGTAIVDQPFTVNSLSLGTTNGVTISGTGTLTLLATAGLTDDGAAAHTISVPLALGAAQTWNVNGTNPFTVAGVISDASGTTGLTIAGTGTVIFTAANSYSGGTTLNAVTLQLGDSLTQNGSVTGNIADNGLLTFANPSAQTFAGVISGTGSVIANGAGVLTFTNAHSYAGGTTIASNATLQLGDGLGSNGSVTGNVSDNGLLNFNNPQPQAVSGAISGSGAVTKTAGGALTLSAAGSYTGGTTVSGGTLTYGVASALPSNGTVTISGGQLNLNGTTGGTVGAVTLASGSITGQTGDTLTGSSFQVQSGAVSAVLAGPSAGLTMTGPGPVVLSAANTYGGGTTISGGLLQYGVANALPTTGAVLVNGGQLDLNNTTGGTVGAVTLTSGSIIGESGDALVASSVNVESGTVSVNLGNLGSTPLVKSGSGTVVLSGDNSYTGGTSVEGGVLAISNSSNLGPGNLSLGAGTLQTTGAYTLDAGTVTLTDPTAGIDTPLFTDDVTLGGLVTGTGGLNKSGPGTLELANTAGANYSGDTIVQAGTLVAGSDNALSPTSNLVIGDGASVILDFGGGEGNDSIGGFAGVTPSLAAPSLAAPTLAIPALAPAGIATVPEPGTLAPLVVGALTGLLVWRRRSR